MTLMTLNVDTFLRKWDESNFASQVNSLFVLKNKRNIHFEVNVLLRLLTLTIQMKQNCVMHVFKWPFPVSEAVHLNR